MLPHIHYIEPIYIFIDWVAGKRNWEAVGDKMISEWGMTDSQAYKRINNYLDTVDKLPNCIIYNQETILKGDYSELKTLV